MQKKLLPQRLPELRQVEIEALSTPAFEVGGDYYDFTMLDEHRLGLIVGDVSGKGVAASMLMAQLHALFRTLTNMGLPLGQIVTQANRVFCESALAGQYATLVCGHSDRSGRNPGSREHDAPGRSRAGPLRDDVPCEPRCSRAVPDLQQCRASAWPCAGPPR